MSDEEDSALRAAPTRTLDEIAEQVAGGFINCLTPLFRSPAWLVCPSDEAEETVVNAVVQAASARGIPAEVTDLRPAPVARLDAITAQLDGWERRAINNDRSPTMSTLLILR